MDNAIVQATADYAETVLGNEGFHYISAVVANCRMLAAELDEGEEDISSLDMDALIIAAYLHNISTAVYGFPDNPDTYQSRRSQRTGIDSSRRTYLIRCR